MEEALRQVGQDVQSLDAARAVSELKALLQSSNSSVLSRPHGIVKKRRYTISAETNDSSSETEDHGESPQSDASARQVSSPVSSRNPREESLAVDDAENPLQLLARASNLHLSPTSSEAAGSSNMASVSLQGMLNSTSGKDMADIERFFNSTQFSTDTEFDMDPINLGLLSEEEADTLFSL